MIGSVHNRSHWVNGSRPTPKPNGPLIALAAACGLAAFAVLISTAPQLAPLIKHTLTQKITVGHALLYIGLPTAIATSLLIGVSLLIKKDRERRGGGDLYDTSSPIRELWASYRQLNPHTSATLGIVAACAILALGVWCTASLYPHAFNHSITLWQGTAYVGGGAVGSVLAASALIFLNAQCKKRREENAREAFKEALRELPPII